MKSRILTMSFLLLCSSVSASESLSVFSSCAKELDSAMKEARAMIAEDFLNNKPQYNIVVGAPYQIGYEYFKVKYTVLSEKPRTLTLEFKYWYGTDDTCNRVEFEDYIY